MCRTLTRTKLKPLPHRERTAFRLHCRRTATRSRLWVPTIRLICSRSLPEIEFRSEDYSREKCRWHGLPMAAPCTSTGAGNFQPRCIGWKSPLAIGFCGSNLRRLIRRASSLLVQCSRRPTANPTCTATGGYCPISTWSKGCSNSADSKLEGYLLRRIRAVVICPSRFPAR